MSISPSTAHQPTNRHHNVRRRVAVTLVLALTVGLSSVWTIASVKRAQAADGWTAASSVQKTSGRVKTAPRQVTYPTKDETGSKSSTSGVTQTANWMFEWEAAPSLSKVTNVPTSTELPQKTSQRPRVSKPQPWDLTSQAEAAWMTFEKPAAIVSEPVAASSPMTLPIPKATRQQATTLAIVTLPAPKSLPMPDVYTEQKTTSASSASSVRMTLPARIATPKRSSAMATVDLPVPKALQRTIEERKPTTTLATVVPTRPLRLARSPLQAKSTSVVSSPPQPKRKVAPKLALKRPLTTTSTAAPPMPETAPHPPKQKQRPIVVRSASIAKPTVRREFTVAAQPTPMPVGSSVAGVPPAPEVSVVAVTASASEALVVTEEAPPGFPLVEEPYCEPFSTACPPCIGLPCSRSVCGVHCNASCQCNSLEWNDSWMIPWEVFAQGEYIGPSRLPHVPEYRLRVDDQIEFVYRLTGEKTAHPYRINTGDTLRIESLTSENLNREVLVQPDGTVSLTHLGQVPAAGRSIEELRADLEEQYKNQVRNPSITVSPIKLNSILEELRSTVDNRFGSGGQSRFAKVTPEGTIQLPAIGSVPAHGLTLAELGCEIEYRYASIVDGLEVTPILAQRAPRFLYVLGEVRSPGRYTLEGPTTLMQAVALAGGWNVGANLKQVVVFRRDENWQLMATKVAIRRPLYGKTPCPECELWLRDSDIVVVPKSPILVVDEFIELVFTRGIYGVLPFSTNLSFVRDLSGVGGLVPIP